MKLHTERVVAAMNVTAAIWLAGEISINGFRLLVVLSCVMCIIAGTESCFLGGDPNDRYCDKFQDEEVALRQQQIRAMKEEG